MYKTILTAAALTSIAAPAFADRYPAPPTEVYVAPEVKTCEPTSVRVYFGNGETVLSKSARRVIEAAASDLEGCSVSAMKMSAVTADGRTAPETETLAASRLAMVASAMTDENLKAEDITARIDTKSATQAQNRMMARRVDVDLAVYRPEIG